MVTRKIIPITLILAGLTLISAFFLFQYVRRNQSTAGLKIETSPPSQVFLDNQRLGSTPFEQMFSPGEVAVKLVPDSTASGIQPYQTKVNLAAGVVTVIKRDFGPTETQSAGEVMTMDSYPGQAARLAVVTSLPATASVSVDGQSQGSTPLLIPLIEPGNHQITVSAPGFTSRSFTAKTVSGYQLNIVVQLSASRIAPTPTPLGEPSVPATASASLTPTPASRITPTPTISASLPRPYVRILFTPTGFLRVRSSPSRSGAEIGQVNPGQLFPLLSSQSGWYQIAVELSATSSGWISSQYAEKFE